MSIKEIKIARSATNFTSKMHSLAFYTAEFTKWCLKITFCNPTWASFRVDRNSSCYRKDLLRVQISTPLVRALLGKKCYISTVLSLEHKSHTITHRPRASVNKTFSRKMEYTLSLGRKETVRNDEEADVLTASLGCSLAYLRNAQRNPKNVRLQGASGQGGAM